MCWRVVDARHAHAHALAHGAEDYAGADLVLDLPAIRGICGSLIYFTDRYDGSNPYDAAFDWIATPKPKGVGFSITSIT